MSVIVLSVVSFLWGVIGLVTVLSPAFLIDAMAKSLVDPWRRFWITQSLLLCGLMLIVGTSRLEGVGLWIACGLIMAAKACVLLGVSDSFRGRLFQLVSGWPHWCIRVGGVLNLGLAVLLSGDLILHG